MLKLFGLAPIVRTVVNHLTGNGEWPSNGHSAMRTTRVIDGLLTDYRNSQNQLGHVPEYWAFGLIPCGNMYLTEAVV